MCGSVSSNVEVCVCVCFMSIQMCRMSTPPDLPVCRMTALPSVLPSYFMTRTQQFTTGVVRTLVTALRNLICLANSCCQAVIGHVYCLARMFGFDCWDVNHDGTAVSQIGRASCRERV